ncbi:hypothetical protein Fmac_001258 [Flemingia macrophylla]|uniref:BHLH domain-containing protein n=1 Tax=Flemingia macrophylla TaxID=520843 RepID=A0ABD1NHB3_9FABA
MGTYNNSIILHDDHHQIPIMGSVNLLQHTQPSSSSKVAQSSSNKFLRDVVGMDLEEEEGEEEEELGAMKEMMYKMAAMQPVDIVPESVAKPKRRNVRISSDPQSVAARHRRERISQKIRILQRLVPGGTKMDTASMLDEAIRYVKFLKRQIRLVQSPHYSPSITNTINTTTTTTTHCPFAPNHSSTTGHANQFQQS